MFRCARITIVLAAAASLPPAVLAQWPITAQKGVPRTPDGKPDLTAKTPRTPDGKPDFSGVWEIPRTGGRPAAAVQAKEGEIPVATFRNAGAGFKDGLPFTPWAAALQKERAAENSKYNPDALCLPIGMMQYHMHGQPRKIIQTPGVIVIMYESNDGLRQIFTDGRPLPKNGDVQPWWFGYSVGKWDGDTLVVETTGLRDGGWLDIIGSPLTDMAKVTERFRRPNYGTMEIDVTFDDPKAYTKPWTVRVNHRVMPDNELIEFVCTENDHSPAHMVGK